MFNNNLYYDDPNNLIPEKDDRSNCISVLSRQQLEDDYIRLYQENFNLKKQCFELENLLNNLSNRMIQISNADRTNGQDSRYPEIQSIFNGHEGKIRDLENEIKILSEKYRNLELHLDECLKEKLPKRNKRTPKQGRVRKTQIRNISEGKEHELSRLEQQNGEVIQLLCEGMNIQKELKCTHDRCERLQKEMDTIKQLLAKHKNEKDLFQNTPHEHKSKAFNQDNRRKEYPRQRITKSEEFHKLPNLNNFSLNRRTNNRICWPCRKFLSQGVENSKEMPNQEIQYQDESGLINEINYRNNNYNCPKSNNYPSCLKKRMNYCSTCKKWKKGDRDRKENIITFSKGENDAQEIFTRKQEEMNRVDKGIMANMFEDRFLLEETDYKNDDDFNWVGELKSSSLIFNFSEHEDRTERIEAEEEEEDCASVRDLNCVMSPNQRKDDYVQRLGLHRYNKIQLPTFKEYIAKMNMFMILLNKDETNQPLPPLMNLKESSLQRIPIVEEHYEEVLTNNLDEKSGTEHQNLNSMNDGDLYKTDVMKFHEYYNYDNMDDSYGGDEKISINDKTNAEADKDENSIVSFGYEIPENGEMSPSEIFFDQEEEETHKHSILKTLSTENMKSKKLSFHNEESPSDSLNKSSLDSMERNYQTLSTQMDSSFARIMKINHDDALNDVVENGMNNVDDLNSIHLTSSKEEKEHPDDEKRKDSVVQGTTFQDYAYLDDSQSIDSNSPAGKKLISAFIESENTVKDDNFFGENNMPDDSNKSEEMNFPWRTKTLDDLMAQDFNTKRSTKKKTKENENLMIIPDKHYAYYIAQNNKTFLSSKKDVKSINISQDSKIENIKIYRKYFDINRRLFHLSKHFLDQKLYDVIKIKLEKCKIHRDFVKKNENYHHVLFKYTFLGYQDLDVETKPFKLKRCLFKKYYTHNLNNTSSFYLSPKLQPARRIEIALVLQKEKDSIKNKVRFSLIETDTVDKLEIGWTWLNLQEVIKSLSNNKKYCLNLFSNKVEYIGTLTIKFIGIIPLRELAEEYLDKDNRQSFSFKPPDNIEKIKDTVRFLQ